MLLIFRIKFDLLRNQLAHHSIFSLYSFLAIFTYPKGICILLVEIHPFEDQLWIVTYKDQRSAIIYRKKYVVAQVMVTRSIVFLESKFHIIMRDLFLYLNLTRYHVFWIIVQTDNLSFKDFDLHQLIQNYYLFFH